jgi:hypothetical protein
VVQKNKEMVQKTEKKVQSRTRQIEKVQSTTRQIKIASKCIFSKGRYKKSKKV